MNLLKLDIDQRLEIIENTMSKSTVKNSVHTMKLDQILKRKNKKSRQPSVSSMTDILKQEQEVFSSFNSNMSGHRRNSKDHHALFLQGRSLTRPQSPSVSNQIKKENRARTPIKRKAAVFENSKTGKKKDYLSNDKSNFINKSQILVQIPRSVSACSQRSSKLET